MGFAGLLAGMAQGYGNAALQKRQKDEEFNRELRRSRIQADSALLAQAFQKGDLDAVGKIAQLMAEEQEGEQPRTRGGKKGQQAQQGQTRFSELMKGFAALGQTLTGRRPAAQGQPGISPPPTSAPTAQGMQPPPRSAAFSQAAREATVTPQEQLDLDRKKQQQEADIRLDEATKRAQKEADIRTAADRKQQDADIERLTVSKIALGMPESQARAQSTEEVLGRQAQLKNWRETIADPSSPTGKSIVEKTMDASGNVREVGRSPAPATASETGSETVRSTTTPLGTETTVTRKTPLRGGMTPPPTKGTRAGARVTPSTSAVEKRYSPAVRAAAKAVAEGKQKMPTGKLGMLVQAYAAEAGIDLSKGVALQPQYRAGLNVLHVALFGDPATGQKGLQDTLALFDNPTSRQKLALMPQLTSPPDTPGTFGNLVRLVESSTLTADEREYVRQYVRAVSAVNALRSVTGLPRATQQLMTRYMSELPNPSIDKSRAEAQERLQLIQREITAALGGSVASPQGEKGSQSADPLGIL